MAAQPLRRRAVAFLLNRLEHVRQVARVVAGPRHQLRAEQVRLLLVFAAYFSSHMRTELRSLGNRLTPTAADHRAGNGSRQRTELESLRLGRVRRAVPKEDVRQFVGHHADDFAFGVGRVEHALTNIGPPGSANALMSFRFTGVNDARTRSGSTPGRDGDGRRPSSSR